MWEYGILDNLSFIVNLFSEISHTFLHYYIVDSISKLAKLLIALFLWPNELI
ncbi:uncharacterized protein METZ01_LOCUS308728, partial [marine metagenome]